jgi:hypothetical protein
MNLGIYQMLFYIYHRTKASMKRNFMFEWWNICLEFFTKEN